MRSLFLATFSWTSTLSDRKVPSGFTATPSHSAIQAHHLSEDFRAGMSFVIVPIKENREFS